MNIIFNGSTVCFYLLGLFVFAQQRHTGNFRGASQTMHLLLSTSCLVGSIAALVYLVIYGVSVSWWAPFILLGVDILIGSFVLPWVSMLIRMEFLSAFGLIGNLVFGSLMFLLL
jgi:hypothetical protein